MLKVVKGTQEVALRMYSTLYKVEHDVQLKKFSLGDGEEKAVLTYKVFSPETIELEHTIVPPSLQGKGLGKHLAEAAFEYALDKKMNVKITCDFVQKYLEKNPKPEFKNIVKE